MKCAWLALAGLMSSGCVSIGLGAPMVIDEAPIDTKRVNVLSSQVKAEVDQDGTELTIIAERFCDVEERARMRQTVSRERINQSPGVTWQLGIYGTILAGVGTGFVVDAQLNVENSDPTGQNYNSVGPDAATAIGAAFLAGAAPMLVIAVVDGFRAVGSEEEISEVYTSRGFVERGSTCDKRVPVASAAVLARTASGTELVLGNTDRGGALDVDLADRVPAEVTLGEKATRLSLYLEGYRIGQADLRAVAIVHRAEEAERAEQAWKSLDTAACENGSEPDCRAVQRYLDKYPHGAHAGEARAVISKGEAKIQQGKVAEQQRREAAAAAAARAAEERRKKEEAAKVCHSKCTSGCKGNAQCVRACVLAKCR